MSSGDMHTFRATTEAWLGQMLLPLLFFSLLIVTTVNFGGLNPWLGGAGLSFLALVAALGYALPMARNWLKMDSRSVQGSFNGRPFHLFWSEVLAAWTYEARRRRFLCLGTREHTHVLPLRFLNEAAIMEQVRCWAPPAALEENAMKRLPEFQQWDTLRSQMLADMPPTVVADHWLLQAGGWAGLTFFLFLANSAVQSAQLAQAGLSAFLAALCGLALVRWGYTDWDARRVERYTLLGRWRMAWEDVRRIEVDPFDMTLVLIGDDRQLAMTGPLLWLAANRKSALALMLAQAEKRGIPLQRTPLAVLKGSHGTRVRG